MPTLEGRVQREPDRAATASFISRAEECEQLVRKVVELHGTVDSLVNSAGIVKTQSLLDIAPQDLELMLDVNLKGVFHLCQSVLKVFVERGCGTIVNIASLAAQRGGG